MRTNRVYVEKPLLGEGSRCRLEAGAAHHIARVLRLRAGDELIAFDGTGGEYTAVIEQMDKDAVIVSLGAQRAIERESSLAITLAQGIARAERMDWVVQKATELGVACIVPLTAERSIVRLDARQAESRLAHWRAIAIAACEQCGRNRLPRLNAPTSVDEFLSAVPDESLRLLLSPNAKLRARDLDPRTRSVTVLIGPEGGLAESEERAAERRGFTSLSLGPRTLRTETAALATLAALQERLGDG
jgi:16S rRNA (uracil1498-N3)-methyltransferase